MMTTESWVGLHDATLESIELRWSSGEAVLRIRTGDPTHPQRVVVASAVRRLACDRQMPWGFSVSINEVRGPAAAGDDASVLEIEMQSGDLIRIEAAAFSLRDAD
jgi:hypothetical protein